MPDYSFAELSPHDFELLCRDLLQAELGLRLESFKTGRDGGIDFRHAKGPDKIIVQCKRYVSTGVGGLLREMEKEAAKLTKLAPSRYILMTAAPLSPANKDAIIAIVGADHLAPGDIFGRDDVNNLLGRHPTVETGHHKLWLAGTAMLQRVLNSEIVNQTDFQVDKIRADVCRYVHGKTYPKARRALEDDHVVILSGLPGVGKTTLANLLLYEHLGLDYEPIVIRQDFSEGLKLFQRGKRQFFHFDDFMGVTFLGDHGSAQQRRDYRAIVEFIEMARSSPTTRLVLTTREHLLTQALLASEQLREAGVIDHRVIIAIGDYTLRQRAEILYNHIFFSDLPDGYRAALLDGEFYFKILRHEKFNPRLIAWLATYRMVKATTPEDFQDFVKSLLDNPAEIWRHAYEQQISDAARSLLLALFSQGGQVSMDELRMAFSKLHALRAAKYGFARRPEDFGTAYGELHGAFVQPTRGGGVDFINPSVVDWLNLVVRQAPDNAIDLILGAQRYHQIVQIWNYSASAVGGETMAVLREHVAAIAAALDPFWAAPRRFKTDDGADYIFGPSYESQLTMLVEIAERFCDPVLLPRLTALIARIEGEWDEGFVEIVDSVALLRAFERATWPALAAYRPFLEACEKALVDEAARGCHGDELRELLLYFKMEERSELLPPLDSACRRYLADYLDDDLRDCRSEAHYAHLINDLEFFANKLGIKLDEIIGSVQHELDQFIADEEAYNDQMHDEYKEQARFERAGEDDIRDLFGSLQSS